MNTKDKGFKSFAQYEIVKEQMNGLVRLSVGLEDIIQDLEKV